MAGVDQILSFVVKQGANELRLGTDDEPQVFAMGARRHFTMSPTPTAVLRQLLGDILSQDREAELAQQHRIAFDYDAIGIGRFQVLISTHPNGKLTVSFVQSAGRVATSSPRAPSLATSAGTPSPKPAVAVTPPEHPSVDGCRIDCSALLRGIVEQAALLGASDVHLADQETPYFRVDGRLQAQHNSSNVDVGDWFGLDEKTRESVMCGKSLELGIALSAKERVRVSVYRMQSGLAAAIRLLPPSAPELGELNLPLPLEGLAELAHGLVLFCGATGSGKSTTLAALSRYALEHRSILLTTLEDPIEFVLSPSAQSLVRQRQIGRDVADFTSGLRDALRGDPDVIMVGELRDAATIRLALTAAETGHLVLASLHSGSASSCIERIVDAYPSDERSQIRVQLADALRAVVVQKLIPRARGGGRVAALEMLRNTHGVANVLREGKTAQINTMLQSGKRDGMLLLERCLADYVKAGTVTAEHAKAVANDLDTLTMYLTK
jgi:twitching motility protein PilT